MTSQLITYSDGYCWTFGYYCFIRYTVSYPYLIHTSEPSLPTGLQNCSNKSNLGSYSCPDSYYNAFSLPARLITRFSSFYKNFFINSRNFPGLIYDHQFQIKTSVVLFYVALTSTYNTPKSEEEPTSGLPEYCTLEHLSINTWQVRSGTNLSISVLSSNRTQFLSCTVWSYFASSCTSKLYIIPH